MRSLVNALIAIIFVLALAPDAPAQDLDQLVNGFDQRREQADQARDEQIKKLSDSYTTALKRLLDRTKSGGNLDAVRPVNDEITAIEDKAATLPPLPDTAPADLKKLRATYDDSRHKILKTHATALTDLAGKLDAALKKLEADLTKAGKIDAAVAAKESRVQVEEDKEVVEARRLVAAKQVTGMAWKPLLDAEWDPTSAGKFYVGDANEKKGQGIGYIEKVKKIVTSVPDRGIPHFVAVPPATVVFRFHRPITEFRSTVWMSAGGDATVRLLVAGKEVGKVRVSAERSERRKLEVMFRSADHLTLEFDPGDSIESDWVVLISPEVR